MSSGNIKWVSEKISPEDLLNRAREAADRAYVPYSKFHVGAAMLKMRLTELQFALSVPES